MMVKTVVSTGRRNHAYASLFAGVKKFLMLVSNEVEEAGLSAGMFQQDAIHEPG